MSFLDDFDTGIDNYTDRKGLISAKAVKIICRKVIGIDDDENERGDLNGV